MNAAQIENRIKRLREDNNSLTNQACSNNPQINEKAKQKIRANTQEINALQRKLAKLQSDSK